MVMGEATVTAAIALLPLLFVAVMVQEAGVNGAVNRPELETAPQEAVQVAAAVAVNCWVAPSFKEAVAGETEKLVFGLAILS
jgi:hypothetical protein